MAIDLEFLAGTEELLKEGRFTKSLIDSIYPDGLIIIENDKTISGCSTSTEQILECPKNELMKKKMTSLFFDKEKISECEKKMREELDEKRYYKCIQVLKTKKGEIKNIELTISPIIGSDKKLVILRDITQKTKTENQLIEMLTNYKTLVDNCNEGILVIQNKIIKFANNAVLKYGGYSYEDIIEKEFTEAVPEEERERLVKNQLRRIIGEKFENTYKTKMLCKNGKVLDIEINSNLVKYNGEPALLVLIRPLHMFKNRD